MSKVLTRLRPSEQRMKLQLQKGVIPATEPRRPSGVGDLMVLEHCVIPVDYVYNNHCLYEISLADSLMLRLCEAIGSSLENCPRVVPVLTQSSEKHQR